MSLAKTRATRLPRRDHRARRVSSATASQVGLNTVERARGKGSVPDVTEAAVYGDGTILEERWADSIAVLEWDTSLEISSLGV